MTIQKVQYFDFVIGSDHYGFGGEVSMYDVDLHQNLNGLD